MNAERQRGGVKSARTAYEGAMAYGDPRTELINRRMAELERLVPDLFAVKKP